MVTKRKTKRKTTKRTTTRKINAKVLRKIRGKNFFLTKFALTNKAAAKITAASLKQDKRVKGTAIVKQGNTYLVYIRVK